MRLKKFKKEEKKKKKTIKIIALCLLVGIVSGSISYAVYQRVDEVLFINARVGNFESNNSDIELAIKLDGEEVETPPNKDNYILTVECDYADGSWDSDRWELI